MSDVHSATVQILGAQQGIEAFTIDLPLSGGEQGTLEAFGIDDLEGRNFTLTAYRNGAAVATAGFAFANVRGPKSGSNGPLSRVRGVSLQDFTSLWEVPAGDREGLGLPPLPPRFQAVLYDIDKPLGSDLPDETECEEKRRSGKIAGPRAASDLLQVAGMDVLIKPGPGFVPRDLEDDYSTAGKTVSAVLGELLFTNGVRWWLEGDLVVVDGRALPQGSFSVPVSDRADVADESWEDDFADVEEEPQLIDYIGRCVENATTDEGVEGTFETNPDGVYPYYEQSGSLGIGSTEGDYASVRGTLTKAGGKLVSQFEEGRGYLTNLRGRMLGPTYVKTVTKTYHDTVRDAEVSNVERTRSYADLGAIQSLTGETSEPTDEQRELFIDLQRKSPYISSEKVTRQRWNAEGLLRVRTESSRNLSGFSTRDVGGIKRVELLYTDEEKVEKWTPVGNGQYAYELSGYTMVDRPVYEIGEDPTQGAEPISIQAVRTPYSKHELTDSPPPSVSIPLPSCEEIDDCLNQAQREYSRDHRDWEARQINGVSVRTHRVAFNCLKLTLRRGQDYGGGRIVGVSHQLGRNTPGGTEVSVVVAHGE